MLSKIQKYAGVAACALGERGLIGTAFQYAAANGLPDMVENMIDCAYSRTYLADFQQAERAALQHPAVKRIFEEFHFRAQASTLTKPEPLEQAVGRRDMEDAAIRGDNAEINKLLDQGISPYDPFFDQSNALISAVHHGHIDCIKTLLNAGAKAYGPRTEELMAFSDPWPLRLDIHPGRSNESSPELIALKKEIIASLPADVQKRVLPSPI